MRQHARTPAQAHDDREAVDGPRGPRSRDRPGLGRPRRPSGPGLGIGELVWEITSNNTAVLEQEGPLATATGPEGVTTSASFYALRPGKSILKFFLVRPSDTDAIPAAKCEVTVRVAE